MSLLLDTNILIDYLNGVAAAQPIVEGEADTAISLVTWMEVLVGARTEREEVLLRSFLSGFRILAVDEVVADVAVGLRRRYRLRLPDAIVWASARAHGLRLLTRDERDFPVQEAPDITVPYRL
ncbi:MAG TPA: type II toxin-antitoxin system VapC family toxin [Rhodospirillales bacterium]|nr:type II toxin-antitoxin system VapC family toxin [Rhodospirillales bacterium]